MLLARLRDAAAQPAAPERREIARGAEAISIERDGWGVPHIRAASFEGIWHGFGYAAAEDRLWQMELFRRDARGTLAEIGIWRIAPEISRETAIEHDLHMRRNLVRPSERARALPWLDADTRAALRAYGDGVNARIADARRAGALPPQFAQLGYEPAAWEAADTQAIWEALMLRSGEGPETALIALLLRQKLAAQHGPATGMDILNDLMPLDDPDAPTLVPRQDPTTLPGTTPTSWDETNGLVQAAAPPEMLEAALAALRRDRALAATLGLPRGWAADALIFGRRRTGGRKAIFAAQLRAEPSPAALFHEVRISGPGPADRPGSIDVRGAAVPGLPAVFAGFNARIAWAADLTRGGDASAYLEAFDEEREGRYALGAAWHDAIPRHETMRVWREGGAPEEIAFEAPELLHGAVLARSADGRLGVCVRRSWRGENISASPLDAFLDLALAASYDDFLDAVGRSIPAQLFFYGDGAGNIALQMAGLAASIEEEQDPRLPAYSPAGIFDWRGYLGFNQLPASVNPQAGFIAAWDSKLASKWPDTRGQFSPAALLREFAREAEAFSPETAAGALLDAARTDGWSFQFAPIFEAARQRPRVAANGDAALACAMLADYDDTRRRGQAAQPLFEAFIERLLRAVFEDDCPGAIARRSEPAVRELLAGAALRLFAPNTPRVMRYDFLNGRDEDEIFAEALAGALREMEERYGKETAKWGEGAGAGDLGFGAAGKAEDAGARGCFMMAVELGAAPAARSILAPGQNESPGSPHFADQLKLFAAGELKPANLERAAPAP